VPKRAARRNRHANIDDPEPPRAVAACIEAARAAERIGQHSTARSHYEDALRRLPNGDAPPTATTILRWIAGSHFAEANHAAAEDCVTAAVAIAEAWGDEPAVGYAVNMLGMFRWQQGELDEAVRHYHDARERAVHAGDAKLAAITAQNLGVIANIRGDFARALQFYQASLADYRAMGLQRDVCVALNNCGMLYTDTERWEEAEDAYREAIELVRDLGDIGLRVQIEVNAVEMWVARGEIAKAHAAADAAMALASELGDTHIPGDAYRLMGVIARESDDLPQAEALLNRAAEVAAARQDLLLLAETAREQAEVHRRQGRNRETLQALNHAHRLFTQLRARHDLADVDRQTTQLESEFLDVVRRWGESIEAKDRYTQGHCERVADLACTLAARSGFDERTLFWFRVGALLHDVGKLIIPGEILNKPTKLDADEWALIKRHPEAGVELLADIDFPWDVRPLIESHHERWDGGGYPHGLAGEAIPLTARILCLADVFDALTSQRSYKQSMSAADAVEIMRRDVGRAFDPALFDVFAQVIAERDQAPVVGPHDGTDVAPAAASRAMESAPHRALHAPAIAGGGAESRRRGVERFVGRFTERRRLEQLLDSALRGTARIVTVTGPIGAGKTSLVSRLRFDARRRGATYVVGTCRASTFQRPYGPWIEIIEELRAARVIPDRRWHSLPTLIPSLTGTQRAPRLERAGKAQVDASLPDEICELLTITAAGKPLVLVIDDADQADHGSWDVIDRLVRRIASDRLLLCLTVDDAAVVAVRSRLAWCRQYHELPITGLSGADIRLWMTDLFSDAGTVRACTSHLTPTEPVLPLWALHAWHGLVDDGLLLPANSVWRIAEESSGVAVNSPQPPSMPAMLARRIDALTPRTRAIIAELALLGDAFEVEVALAAGIGDQGELLGAIDEALAAGILRDDGAEPGTAFAFTHAAVAAFARRAVESTQRGRLHERIARALEQVRPVALFEIAEHFDRSALADRAFEYALLAAGRAVSVQAYADATAMYDRARMHATSPGQLSRLDALLAQLPIPRRCSDVA